MRDSRTATRTSEAEPYQAAAQTESAAAPYDVSEEREEMTDREEHSAEPHVSEAENPREGREADLEHREAPALREFREEEPQPARMHEPEPARRAPYQESRRPSPPPERPREFKPASPVAIAEAIQDVNQIVDNLRNALDEMEDVLECLELAERQKDADEQEIESLRRSLRQLHRPRDQGNRH